VHDRQGREIPHRPTSIQRTVMYFFCTRACWGTKRSSSCPGTRRARRARMTSRQLPPDSAQWLVYRGGYVRLKARPGMGRERSVFFWSQAPRSGRYIRLFLEPGSAQWPVYRGGSVRLKARAWGGKGAFRLFLVILSR
jgi:hypothetical protein